MIRFTVPGAPQGKARPRITRYGAYTPQKTVDYENLVKISYRQKHREIFDNKEPLKMIIKAYFEPVKSTTKKARKQMLSGEIKVTKKPDIDNIAKSICDALNGVAYTDDGQIVGLEIYKIYDEEARVEVEIEVIEVDRVDKIT